VSDNSDRDKIVAAMGGKRGLLDSGLPSIVFLISFTLTKDVRQSGLISVGLALIFTVIRLARKETLQHALSGLFGVAICAWFSSRTGKAEDYFLPGLWTNFGYGLAYMLSNLIGWPVIGVIIGPILGENFTWRKNLARRRMYAKATWIWVGMFALKLLIQVPLYKSGNLGLLGTARIVMGYPLYFAVAWFSWLVIRNGPQNNA
jgi:hypothetical protein